MSPRLPRARHLPSPPAARHRPAFPAALLALTLALLTTPATAQQPPDPPPSTSIELELRQLCDTIARGIRRLPGDTRYRRVTVLPFAGNDDDPAARDARRLVTDYLSVACLTHLHDLAVVDPGDTFADLLPADALTPDPAQTPTEIPTETPTDTPTHPPTALTTRATAHDIHILITGRLTRGPATYTTTARVIAADTGEQYAALLHPLPITPTDRYATSLFAPRTAAGAALRSAAWPGWGQLYNGETTEGILFIATQTALLGTATGFFIASGTAWDAYHQDVAERVADKQRAQDYETRAAIALSLAGLVWAGSIIDAWIDGYRYDPERAFAPRPRPTPLGSIRLGGTGLVGQW